MRVFSHIDDEFLPVAALRTALLNDRDSLISVSSFDEIVVEAETGISRDSNLFVLSRAFRGSSFQSSKLSLDTIAQRVSVALTLRREDFFSRTWRLEPRVGWVITDVSPPELHLSLRLAAQGHCRFPTETRPMERLNTVDHLRVESMKMRECSVLMHIALGMSDSTISRELGLSKIEIVRNMAALYQKLAVSSRAEAGAFYVRFRNEIIVHRKSLMRDIEKHSPTADLRLVGD